VRAEYRYSGRPHGERFWAKPLGAGLYELRNVPWYAYRLNFGDVVRAVADDPERVPRIVEAVSRSGHHTIRIFFSEEIRQREQEEILAKLDGLHATHERAGGRLLALDVEPGADYGAVLEHLRRLEEADVLTFEEAWPGDGPGFDEPPA
jgi:Domain of unknown function (DUF4265)